jgi:membrane-bound inhibitor of C-type lysozyme
MQCGLLTKTGPGDGGADSGEGLARAGTTLGLALIVALVAGCVYVDDVRDTVLPARIDYSCAGNKVLPVSRSPDQRNAAVLLDGKWVMLARADSAAQEKYTDGTYALYLLGERAMLEDRGRVVYGPCTSPVDLPTARRSR